ncbi:hypothetical protein HNY73_000108 [Argiope bruennichi]|uniref:Uncharacterized protein n=1 Tax=Argiope bruennichi TaxID=94029 RepID=A0A8T0FY46_ARGBR|nr:hypothetical protein HNY73_000108 [Argiope bruennichi]
METALFSIKHYRKDINFLSTLVEGFKLACAKDSLVQNSQSSSVEWDCSQPLAVFSFFTDVFKLNSHVGPFVDLKTTNELLMYFDFKTNQSTGEHVINFAVIRSNVGILRHCCKEFGKQFLEVSEVNLFTYITIAFACMAAYSSQRIQEDTISMVPVNGYLNNTLGI